MYIFVIFSSLLCLQLISIVVSDSNDAGQLESPTLVNIASDEDYDYLPRSTSFLRFGRQLTPSSGSFLRFGRSPSNFLQFGRSNPSGGNFLRFGREIPSTNFLRFGRKGEFLRFG